MDNVADSEPGRIDLRLRDDRDRKEDRTFKELILKPQWYRFVAGESVPYSSASKLIPDAIIVHELAGELCFGVFDAKYYTPKFTRTEEGELKLVGAPGVGDVTKQYLYLSAYKDLIERNGFTRTANVFLVPGVCQEIEELGWVDFSEVMGRLKGSRTKFVNEVVMFALPAEMVWEHFLNDQKLGDEMIARLFVGPKKDVPDPRLP